MPAARVRKWLFSRQMRFPGMRSALSQRMSAPDRRTNPGPDTKQVTIHFPPPGAPDEKETPPPKVIQDLAVAYWASRCLHVIAELGIADALGDEAQTAQALAGNSGVNPQALHRVLRSLANHGIFVHDGERFAHNAASRLLRSDVPGSMRSLARMMGLKVHWDAYRELDTGLRTGKPAISAVIGGWSVRLSARAS